MALHSYIVREGDSLFDIAARLYDTDFPLGLQDLLTQNSLSLDDPLPANLFYSDDLTRSKQKISVPIQPEQKFFIVREQQSHFDLAIQLYGRFDAIGKILPNLPTLDELIPAGTELPYPDEDTKDSLFFADQLVATALSQEEIDARKSRLLEDGDDRITEEGELRILES